MRAEAAVVREANRVLDDAGLVASVAVRDLRSGRTLAIAPDRPYPLASVVKLPLALSVLVLAARGEVDLDEPVRFDPARRTPGRTGLSRFRNPATVTIGDVLYLAIAASDDTAADALFDRCAPERVTSVVRDLGVADLTVRHAIRDLHATIASRLGPDEQSQALTLAIRGATPGGGHLIPQLDVTGANAGTASALLDLLGLLWHDPDLTPHRDELRPMLAGNLMRQRLAPDLESDDATWYSKTGSFLHLRHEVGVLEHADGGVFAIVALSESIVPAQVQPSADQALGHAARLLHDEVRAGAR